MSRVIRAARLLLAPGGGAAAPFSGPSNSGSAPGAPDHAEIEIRAHAIWEARQRQGTPGDALTDWLQAEREPTMIVTRPVRVAVAD